MENNNFKRMGKIVVTVILIAILASIPFVAKIVSYNNAISLFEEKKYEDAVSEFKELGEYKDSQEYLFESTYKLARQYLAKGKSQEALLLFDELKSHNNSKYSDYSLDINYFTAQAYMNEKKYDMALDILEKIKNKTNVEEDIRNAKYLKAVELYEEQNYEEAIKIFNEFDKSYKDVEDYIERYPKQRFIGDWVFSDEDYMFRAYSFTVVGAKITEEDITFLTREYDDYMTYKYKIDGDILIPMYQNVEDSERSIQYISEDHLVYRTKGYSGNTLEYDMKRGKVNKRKEPYVGMTAADLLDSTWGMPEDINKTTTVYGVHEQWCYSGYRYVYLDDGIVTGVQE